MCFIAQFFLMPCICANKDIIIIYMYICLMGYAYLDNVFIVL